VRRERKRGTRRGQRVLSNEVAGLMRRAALGEGGGREGEQEVDK